MRLFNVKKFNQYGKLSGRNIEDMIAGSRVEVAPFKENEHDFVLWKPSEDDEPSLSSDCKPSMSASTSSLDNFLDDTTYTLIPFLLKHKRSKMNVLNTSKSF